MTRKTGSNSRASKGRICVVGLGTIGGPTALTIKNSGLPVIGYDIDKRKSSEFPSLEVYSDWDELPRCSAFILCVPTGLDGGRPDMSAVNDTVKKIASSQGTGLLVSIESTVSIGTSRAVSELIPEDLVVHVPHRYWSKDPSRHGVRQTRVIGASDCRSMDAGRAFYGRLKVPLLALSSFEEAEMTKIMENAFRFVQIAFAEEASLLCTSLGIDWHKVREAANTKWNIDIPEAREGIDGCLAKDIRYLTDSKSLAGHRLLREAIRTDRAYARRKSR